MRWSVIIAVVVLVGCGSSSDTSEPSVMSRLWVNTPSEQQAQLCEVFDGPQKGYQYLSATVREQVTYSEYVDHMTEVCS